MGLRFYAGSRVRIPPAAATVNAPPVNTVPAAQTTYIDTTKRFTVADGNSVRVADNDAPLVTTTLTCSTGTLEVIPNSGVIVSNNVSARIIVVGSVANLNRALDGLRWTPVSAFAGVATITVRTSDGENVDIDSFTVTVSGAAPPYVPPGPTNSVPTSTKMTPYGMALSFASQGMTVYDPDVPTLTTTLTMVGGIVHVSTAGGGTITGNDTGLVTLVGTHTQISAALGTLVYTPSAGFTGYGKITVSTTNGSKTDTDIIDIVVGPPELPPVNFVPPQPFSVAVGSGAKFTSGPGPDNSMKITAAYKSSLRTTISCGHGLLKYDTAGTGPTLQPDKLTAKIVYGYWNGAAALNVKSVSQHYTCIGLLRARNAGSGLGNGAVSWPYAGFPAANDVQQVRARGQRVFLVIGGPGYGFNYTTRVQSDNLLMSLIPLIYSLGGVDGVDFQNYDGDLTGLSLTTEAVYIANQLKGEYGVNFNIVYSFRQNPASQQVIDIAKALNNANCLTFCQQIFMENAANKTQYAVSNKVLQFLTDSQIVATKVVIGMSHNYDYTNNLSLSECTREWGQVIASQPNVRGVSCFSADLDNAVGWAFLFQFKFTTIGITPMDKGQSVNSGWNTKSIQFVGDASTVGASLSSVYYDPDAGYYGPDPVVMVTTDGTLSDTDQIAVTVYP